MCEKQRLEKTKQFEQPQNKKQKRRAKQVFRRIEKFQKGIKKRRLKIKKS